MAREDNLRNIDEYNKTLTADERTENARRQARPVARQDVSES